MPKNLTNKPSDGTTFGQDTADKISFFGYTPIAQRANATQATITAGATTTVCNTAVAEIQTLLVAYGLAKGAA